MRPLSVSLLIGVALLAGSAAMTVSAAHAQSPAASDLVCGAPPQEIVTTDTQFVPVTVTFADGSTLTFLRAVTETTRTNYMRVDGLIRFESTDPFGQPIVTYSYPSWLLAAYGGSMAAIQYDLAAGFLHDRGRCS